MEEKMKRAFLVGFFLLSAMLAACAPKGVQSLTVMTHDSFSASEEVITAFEAANLVEVNFLKSGDAGQALNKAILSKEAPLADLFFGVDNTFLSRALEAGIFEPALLSSLTLETIPAEFLLDPSGRAIPIDYGDICINYDRAFFASHDLAVPSTLEELIKPEYRGLLVVENPATSSPGLGFLLATISHFGEDGFLEYWQQLTGNGLVVVDGWSTAYYTNFSASSGHGNQPLVVSYSSSPAAEVVFASEPISEPPTGSILGQDTCFRQVEFAGILAGTRQAPLARKFMEYMLSTPFQEDIPLQMFMYPVNPAARLPDVFIQHAAVSLQPADLDPAFIASGRDKWIEEWTNVVLH
jgi:thiamine transport system substrate-binding protein